MKIQRMKFTRRLSATLFSAALMCLAPIAAQAQGTPISVKPGEIIYGRFVTNPNSGPNCSTTSIWAVGQDGSNDRRLFSNGVHPRISPDGRFIMFKRFDPSALCIPYSAGAEIWVRELATGRETLITNFTQPFGTFFTPETNRADNQIIFDTGGVVCRVNIGGTNRFCNNLGVGNNFTHPSVRGDDYLTVMANERPQPLGGLYTFNYNLTNPQRIPNTSSTDESPSWSNDGQTIAYGFVPPPNDNPQFYADLYKINADGSNKTRLTFLNGTNGGSPNGFRHSIVWTTNSVGDEFIFNAVNVNNVPGIYRIATDGSGNMARIPTVNGNAPDWVGGIVPVFGEQQVASFGGGLTSNGNLSLVSTVGQAFAGQTSTGGGFDFQSGFWTSNTTRRAMFDFDGDGKTDISIFRPSAGEWWHLRSSDRGNRALQFGMSSDTPSPADYTGDGITDMTVFRPSTGEWFVLRSEDFSFFSFPFGISEDIPVPADYDGDGKDDVAVFRPSSATWYINRSGDNGTTIANFGINGDRPVAADYDGDGEADIAIFRPSDGSWWISRSTGGVAVTNFGTASDKTVPGDYTGDGKADVAVWRPSTGEWYILRSEDSSFFSRPFGSFGDAPSPGDFDGDGRNDLAVFRPSAGTWYVNGSTSGIEIVGFGIAGDRPVPGLFVR